MKKKIFFRILKNLFQSSYINIQGMQKYLGGPQDPFPARFHISGRFRPNNRSHHQNSKNLKNLKKSRFSFKKIDFFLRVYIDLYDGIWAEIGLQGCLKCFLSKIRYLHYFWTTLEKSKKSIFLKKICFVFFDLRPNIDFPAEFRPEIGRKPFHTIIPPSKKNGAH